MGGYGSGRHGGRGKAEEFWSLDVNKMHRAGVFTPGRAGGWQWTQDGERVADIQYRMETDGLRLIYRVRQCGGEFEDVNYVVPVTYADCTYGGERPYFRCPGVRNGWSCRRRVAKLYAGGRYFLCRHCHDLANASQWEGPADRCLRRANKKRMALGGEPGTAALLPERPKGMWQRTYRREIEAILAAEDRADAHFLLWAATRFPAQMINDLFI